MIQLTNLSLQRGIKTLIKDANIEIYPGHKIGIIGANGCGKSTLFSMLRGELQADAGDCIVPKHWRIVSVAQETPASEKSALEYVIDGDTELRKLQAQLLDAEDAHQGEKIAELHEKLAHIGAYDVEARAAVILDGLGFSTAQLQNPVSDFSGGWRMRLNLAQALLCESDLLLLDEPTNHLDLDAVIWLENWIKGYKGTLLLISHDKSFIDECVGGIVSFEQTALVMYSGNYSGFEKQRAERLRLQASEYEKQAKKKAHLNAFITRFKAKASKAKQAQSRVKQLEKMQDLMPVHAQSAFSFEFKIPDKLPNPLVLMEEVKVGYGETVILNEVKMNLVPGSRIGLLGKNGAGKSTLIKLLSEQLSPMSGEYHTSAGLKIGYFAQHQVELLHLDSDPFEHLFRLDKKLSEQEIRDYLGGFGFQGDEVYKQVNLMSGGEKARLVLALIVYQKPNMLLLDEPTNHLDIEMRQALNYALQAFEGAMVLVSHDRYLLSTVCDDFYLVDSGEVSSFKGDLDDYKKWLFASNAQAAKSSKMEANGHVSEADKKSVDRKQQKRLEAELRQKTKPFRDEITKQEKRMEKAQKLLAEIEATMADNSLYEAVNKAKLTKVLEQKASADAELEEAEMLWLDAQESLEALLS
ncbi:ATP-binding cassette domain-containing protein [Glaciecola sp. KUL10]|uniref:ATP-binding cassette domain-containing protein n=1 Tax=Glaciecola sp. (strain KUL10) TaxID=2161813 RepID=UPI000D785BD0|nr:ATP-binding cassette domain-containing protein [Glaciecola sp. KUL10]GBL04372.1 ABC transporter ATP-binding protein [Glaciecola sp. KUL10]